MKAKYTGAHPNLTPGKIYRVLGIEGEYYRILNDKSDPCMYEREDFEIVDSTRPSDWFVTFDEDGYEHTIPKPLNRPYFYEAYHDYNPNARVEFNDYLASIDMITDRERDARNAIYESTEPRTSQSRQKETVPEVIPSNEFTLSTEPRRLQSRQKETILEVFPSKEKEIGVVAVKGGHEALQFAEQYREFLAREGYTIRGGIVSQAEWYPPVWGVEIIPELCEIRVGTDLG